MSEAAGDLDQYIIAAQEPFEDGLRTLVEIPSVSQHAVCKPDVRRCILSAEEYLQILMKGGTKVDTKSRLIGWDNGLPAVYWKCIRHRKWPTIILYNHLDVQPAEQKDGWDTEPFELVILDAPKVGRQYFGRGTTDDKGPALVGLLAIKFALLRGLPLNFVVVWESEEEDGSMHFPEILAQIKDDLQGLSSPSLLISDTIWPAVHVPSVSCGLRGVINFTFELTTAIDDRNRAKGVHSGLCGGVATNPIIRLSHVIAASVDEAGWVAVRGAHDGLAPLPAEALEAFAQTDAITLETFKRDFGLRSCFAGSVPDLLNRIWNLPTFEVTGIIGGVTEPAGAVKTEIPGYARAHVSCRLGPGQDPVQFEQALRKHVARIDSDMVIIRRGGVSRPFAMDPKGPYLQAAAEAFKTGFGYPEVVFDRCGGSIGAVIHFTELLPGLPVVLLGLSLPTHNYHGTNENFDWRQAAGGIRTFVHYFERVANMPTAQK